MAHNSDFSYIHTSSDSGLSIEEVSKSLIRPGCGDVGMLCADKNAYGVDVGKINKWAKFKPIRHFTLGILTAQQRIDKSYGFAVDGTNAIYAHSMKAVYNAAVANAGDWPYLRPRGVNTSLNYNEPLRLLDFDGYKSATYQDGQLRETAVCPIIQSGPWSTISLQNRNYAEIQVKDVHSGVEFSHFKQDSHFTSASVYLLYPGQYNVIKAVRGYHVDEFQDSHNAVFGDILDGKDVKFNPPISLQNKKVLVAISNAPNAAELGENDDDYEWLYLPNALKTIPTENFSVDFEAEFWKDTAGNGELYITCSFTVTNNFNGSQSQLYFEVDRIEIHGLESSEAQTFRDSTLFSTITPGHSYTDYSDDIQLGPNYEEGETLSITLYYKYRKASEPQQTGQKTVYTQYHQNP